jgi:formate dehydrogenase-N alpha subunit
VASFPDKNKVVRSLSKLKYMVVIDPLVTETSTFWQNHGESNDVDPAAIQTEVFRLPSTCFAEEDGSIANSGRWLQWHWKGQDAPGEARNDGEILAGIYHRLRELYRTEGGKGAEPLLKMSWRYKQPDHPESEEVAKENNGYALADLYDANGTLLAKKGQLLNSFALLRDDGTRRRPAGSMPAAGRSRATRWRTAITPILRAWAIRWAGPGRGRSTAGAVQPRFGGYQRQAVGCEADADPVERQQVGRERYSGLQYRAAGQQHRAVYHAAGGAGSPVCAR